LGSANELFQLPQTMILVVVQNQDICPKNRVKPSLIELSISFTIQGWKKFPNWYLSISNVDDKG
jgi:hypothetical protein